MTTTAATSIGGLDGPAEVLDFARWCRCEADRFEANLMLAAVTWAEQHPPESIDTAATWGSPAGDTGLVLAGAGAPLVSEFAIAEFALAIGRSTDSGRVFVATAVELKYRLPRTWARVLRGDLPAWRARRIAETTVTLTFEAAGFVDAQVSAFAHRIGHAQLERLVAEATMRFMPDQARANAEKAAEGRHVTPPVRSSSGPAALSSRWTCVGRWPPGSSPATNSTPREPRHAPTPPVVENRFDAGGSPPSIRCPGGRS